MPDGARSPTGERTDPLTPEELAAATDEAEDMLLQYAEEPPQIQSEENNHRVCRALLHYKAEAERNAVDARRWRIWRQYRPLHTGTEDVIDRETGDHLGRIEHWATPTEMDQRADQITAQEASK